MPSFGRTLQIVARILVEERWGSRDAGGWMSVDHVTEMLPRTRCSEVS